MTTHDALLAAVLANPADDLPRLVLADWLEEHGEPERADFIRLQVALAANERGKRGKTRRRELQRRITNFMRGAVSVRRYPWFNTVLDEWKLELMVDGWKYVVGGSYGRGVTFRRGFVSEVRCTLADWCGGGYCVSCTGTFDLDETPPTCQACDNGILLGIGPRLVREHPVERVVVTDREPWHNDRGSNPRPCVPEELRLPDVWVWFRNHNTDAPDDRYRLPLPIWNLVQRDAYATTAGYPSRDDAYEALSAALIVWARGDARP